MKKVLIVLMFVSVLCYGQRTIEKKPTISTTAYTVSTTSGNDTITSFQPASITFDSCAFTQGSDTMYVKDLPKIKTRYILVGSTITNDSVGTGLTVLSIVNDTTLVMSDTALFTIARDTCVFANSGQFAAVTSGVEICGAGIPLGSTVTKIDSVTLVLSSDATATTTTTAATLRMGIFTSLAYSAGDALGFPFKINYPINKILDVEIIDDAKQITSCDVVLFNREFTATADNSAFSPSDADAEGIIKYFVTGGSGGNIALGVNTIMNFPPTTLPKTIGTSQVWVQLVVVGTPTFTAVDNLTVRFVVE